MLRIVRFVMRFQLFNGHITRFRVIPVCIIINANGACKLVFHLREECRLYDLHRKFTSSWFKNFLRIWAVANELEASINLVVDCTYTKKDEEEEDTRKPVIIGMETE